MKALYAPCEEPLSIVNCFDELTSVVTLVAILDFISVDLKEKKKLHK